jgi:exodeoxyribonuclease III
MKLISWNVNGIRAVHNKGLFTPFIDKYDPDILCLQETKAEQSQSPIDLPQYTEYWNSAVKKGYSGTAIFTKTKPKNIIYGFSNTLNNKYNLKDKYGDATCEGRVLTLEFNDFYIVNVYTPNSKDDLSRLAFRHDAWDKAFLEHCVTLETAKPVIFCGDLNVAHTELDLARPKENNGKHGFTMEERTGVNNIIDTGFMDTFRMFNKEGDNYTWWTAWGGARARNVGWRIDYFFASKKIKDKIQKAEILNDVMGSDHCPVSLEISL